MRGGGHRAGWPYHHVPALETDQEGAGRVIGVPFGSATATCPLRAFAAWITAAGITEGPSFRVVSRHAARPPVRPRRGAGWCRAAPPRGPRGVHLGRPLAARRPVDGGGEGRQVGACDHGADRPPLGDDGTATAVRPACLPRMRPRGSCKPTGGPTIGIRAYVDTHMMTFSLSVDTDLELAEMVSCDLSLKTVGAALLEVGEKTGASSGNIWRTYPAVFRRRRRDSAPATAPLPSRTMLAGSGVATVLWSMTASE